MIITLAMSAVALLGANAMSYERAREEALYLTDKMAYELNLNDQQYNDAYEINLDYLLSLADERDLYGSYLEYRLNDLRQILYDWQYDLMLAADYFVRPVIWRATGWFFPIYSYYRYGWYYYDRPAVFWNYRGGHGRIHFHGGYYANRRPVWHGGMRGVGRDRSGWSSIAPQQRHGGNHGGFRHDGRGGVPRSRGEFRGDRGNGGQTPGMRGGSDRHNGGVPEVRGGDNRHSGSVPNGRGGDNRQGGDALGSAGGHTGGHTPSGHIDTRSMTGRSGSVSGNRGSVSSSRSTTMPGSRGSVSSSRSTTMPGSRGSVSSSRSSAGSSQRGNLFSGSSTRSTVGSSLHGSSHSSGSSMRSGSSRGGSFSSGGHSGGGHSSGHSGGSHGSGGGRGGRR